jgi:hypothetical protein
VKVGLCACGIALLRQPHLWISYLNIDIQSMQEPMNMKEPIYMKVHDGV